MSKSHNSANTANKSTNTTTAVTASGDNKGELQAVAATDVGNLNNVLGDLENAAAVGDTAVTVIEEENIVNVSGDPAVGAETGDVIIDPPQGGSIEEIAAAAAPAPTAGVVTQRAEVTKATVMAERVAFIEAAVEEPKKTIQPGTVVKSTGAVPVAQLPEVLAAMEVGKMQTNSALNSILEYVRDMHPGQGQNAASIEKNQVKLLNALQTILMAEDTNFKVVFQGVLAIVKANRNDAFAITMRNRGLNSVSLATIDNVTMRFLTRLVDTLHVASGLNDISKTKEMVDMNKLLAAVTNVRAKNNLTAFFS